MLKFLVFDDGRPAASFPIRNAYLIGSDGCPVRGSVTFDSGAIVCEKREPGVAALALQQPVGDCGELTIQTTHLPERDEPYLLNLELARHRLMLLYNKLEDWALFDIAAEHSVMRRMELARKLFIESLCLITSDVAAADKAARDALVAAIDGSEELAVIHADLLLARRKATGAVPKHAIGCGVALEQTQERLRNAVLANFDFLYLPTPWKALAPEEGDYHLGPLDNWVEWAARNRLPIISGPVVSFDPQSLPDWLFIWEHEYETVRDVIYEHVEHVVTRYKNAVTAWNVVSGLHVNQHFTFSFEQLLDLTRMCTMLVRKIQPLARTLVEIRQPFGEYFATASRSIPPRMYIDMLVQGAVNFDAIAVRLLMGQALPGQYTRDLMQVSHLLDELKDYGKPLHLIVGAPSEPVMHEMIAVAGAKQPVDVNCGFWRKPWSNAVQARWLEAVFQIALSKPTVESVVWPELMDHPGIELPLSGLISEEMQPKPAFRRLLSFRRSLHEGAPAAAGSAGAAAQPAK